ncbi:MAG: AAA family ATPase [Flectobacillus sp.]|uniref:AAA family ATPase n=1 Tax=Flectobacillus sp. TaxID=50419 RepID=UPI003B9B081B
MLQSIEIEHFRCFNKIKVNGFKNINLISGLNNAGKTALLESLLICSFPTPQSINILRKFRSENDKLITRSPEKVWNSFFNNLEIDKPIQFNTVSSQNEYSSTHINSVNDVSSVIETISNSELPNLNEKLISLLGDKFQNSSILNIESRILENTYSFFLLPDKEDDKIGALGRHVKDFQTVPFLHTHYRINDTLLASLYSTAKELRKISHFNQILTVIDNSIVGSEIDAPGGEPVIKLILKNEQSLPLGLFGDAVRKIAELMLIVLNNDTSVVFIDEIENGIHYTKQEELWRKLFEIVGDKVQIFATSHSLEMIKAFNKVASSESLSQHAMYYEMSRNQQNGQIVVNPMTMEMLKYEIMTNNQFRGE